MAKNRPRHPRLPTRPTRLAPPPPDSSVGTGNKARNHRKTDTIIGLRAALISGRPAAPPPQKARLERRKKAAMAALGTAAIAPRDELIMIARAAAEPAAEWQQFVRKLTANANDIVRSANRRQVWSEVESGN